MAKGDKRPVVMQSDRAVPSGIATLDVNGKLVQMPTPTDIGTVAAANPYKRVDTSGWYRIGIIPNYGAWRFVFGGGWGASRQKITVVDLTRNFTSFDASKIIGTQDVYGVTQLRAVNLESKYAIDVYCSLNGTEILETACVSYYTDMSFVPAETIELITDEVTPAFTFAFQ